jgi:hypothetical protein
MKMMVTRVKFRPPAAPAAWHWQSWQPCGVHNSRSPGRRQRQASPTCSDPGPHRQQQVAADDADQPV